VTKKATTTKKAPAKKAVAEESDSSSSDEEEAPAKPIKKAAPKKAPAKKAAPKEAAPKKAVPAKKTATKKAAPKRKADEQSGSDEESSGSDIEEPPAKKPATHAKPKKEPVLKAVVPKAIKFGPTINKAPTQLLDVFVFGEGSAGELGLGNKTIDNKKPIDVKRPRYNEKLSKMGIVEISVGGMHCVALTSDNRIVTWGVNDQGALGRDTTYEGGLRDMDAAESDDSDDEDALNPYESTPNYVDAKHFEEGTVFTNVVASDSASFAVTADGQVYGWGTFRVSRNFFFF
jgi:regulator of chromosome condensation